MYIWFSQGVMAFVTLLYVLFLYVWNVLYKNDAGNYK